MKLSASAAGYPLFCACHCSDGAQPSDGPHPSSIKRGTMDLRARPGLLKCSWSYGLKPSLVPFPHPIPRKDANVDLKLKQHVFGRE